MAQTDKYISSRVQNVGSDDDIDLISKTVCNCLNSVKEDTNVTSLDKGSSTNNQSFSACSLASHTEPIHGHNSSVDKLMLDNLQNHQDSETEDKKRQRQDEASSQKQPEKTSRAFDGDEEIYVETDHVIADRPQSELDITSDDSTPPLDDYQQIDPQIADLYLPHEEETKTQPGVAVAPTAKAETTYIYEVVPALPGLIISMLIVLYSGIFSGPELVESKPTAVPTYSHLQAEIDRLLKDIATIQSNISTEYQAFQDDFAAKRQSSALSYRDKINQSYLFESTRVGQIDGKFSSSKQHIENQEFERAVMGLRSSKIDYQYQLDQLLVSGDVFAAKQNSRFAYRKWQSAKREYGLKDPIYVPYAKISEKDALSSVSNADFKLTSDYWQLATTLWNLSYEVSLPEINRIKANRQGKKLAAAQQAAREAEEAERQRLLDLQAAEEAKRLAALAEAQRLEAIAAAEAAKKQAAEAKKQKLVTIAVGRMRDIPAGEFVMGCNEGGDCLPDQQPARTVNINAFRIGEAEVTFEQWDACVELGGCSHKPKDKGWGRGLRPVIDVSFKDITEQFIPTLNQHTGRTFRLPTEAEWEYAARGGSDERFSWGDDLGEANANCLGCGSEWDNAKTSHIKSFEMNGYGLYDMHGNVMEWTQDCWKSSYKDSPTDGSSYLGTPDKDEFWILDECRKRVLRGGAWSFPASFVEAGARNWNPMSIRSGSFGFRLVEEL